MLTNQFERGNVESNIAEVDDRNLCIIAGHGTISANAIHVNIDIVQQSSAIIVTLISQSTVHNYQHRPEVQSAGTRAVSLGCTFHGNRHVSSPPAPKSRSHRLVEFEHGRANLDTK